MVEPDASARVLTDVDGDSAREVALRFQAGAEELFGILTEPAGVPRGIGVIYFGAMWDRNRFSVKLARRLAAAGFHALRFDYRGVGESTGTREKWLLDRPATADLHGAVEEMRRRGLEQLVLIGRCFGARTVLSAVERIGGLRGLAFLSLPLPDKEEELAFNRYALTQAQEFLRRGFRPRVLLGVLNARRRARFALFLRSALRQAVRGARPRGDGAAAPPPWLSQSVLHSLRSAVTRRLPLLFVYGAREEHYWDFQQAQAGEIGMLLAEAGERVRVSTVDGSVHHLTDIRTQEQVLSRVQEWVESLAPPPALS